MNEGLQVCFVSADGQNLSISGALKLQVLENASMEK